MNTRKLIIKKLDPIKRGQRKDGKGDWTLFEVGATTTTGEPINEKLKTFSEFPVGQEIEVALEKEEHEVYGVSFMLHPLTKARQAEIFVTERLDDLEKRVQALEGNKNKSTSAAPEDTEGIPF